MKKTILAAVLLFSATTMAHVKPGTYTGKDQDSKACQFTIGDEWFENNQPHPLNERLPVTNIQFEGVTIEIQTWNVGHPPVVDASKGLVRFNHDLFQQVVATKFGAATLIVLKNAEETPEGHEPTGIIYIDDNYRSKADSKKLTCTL